MKEGYTTMMIKRSVLVRLQSKCGYKETPGDVIEEMLENE